jgi:hypothetical protein
MSTGRIDSGTSAPIVDHGAEDPRPPEYLDAKQYAVDDGVDQAPTDDFFQVMDLDCERIRLAHDPDTKLVHELKNAIDQGTLQDSQGIRNLIQRMNRAFIDQATQAARPQVDAGASQQLSQLLQNSDKDRPIRGDQLLTAIGNGVVDPGNDGNELGVFVTYFKDHPENLAAGTEPILDIAEKYQALANSRSPAELTLQEKTQMLLEMQQAVNDY